MRPRRGTGPPTGAGMATLALVTALATGLLPSPALGQGAGSGASTVLRIPPAPRPHALGNAMVAVTGDWAAEYNPAGAAANAISLSAAYQALPVGASAGAVAVVAPVAPRVALAGSLRFVDYGGVDVIEPDPTLPVGHPTGETATGGELTALVGAAVTWGRLRGGVAGRWLRVDVAGLVDDAAGFDAGMGLRVGRGLELGAAVQNLGGHVRAGRPAPLPRTVRGGAALRHGMAGLDALVAVEARHREGRTGVGAGFELRGGAAVEGVARIGLESRPDPGDAFSRLILGGGVRIDRLMVDLAYRALGPLGSTQQVGLSYRF
jgi:hypothetical protein